MYGRLENRRTVAYRKDEPIGSGRLGLFQQRPFVRVPVSAKRAGFGKLLAGQQGSSK